MTVVPLCTVLLCSNFEAFDTGYRSTQTFRVVQDPCMETGRCDHSTRYGCLFSVIYDELISENALPFGRNFAVGGEEMVVMANFRDATWDLLMNDLVDSSLYSAESTSSLVGGNNDEYRAFAVPQGTMTRRISGGGAPALVPLSSVLAR